MLHRWSLQEHNHVHVIDDEGDTRLHDLLVLLRLASIRLNDTKRLFYLKIHDERCPGPCELFRTAPDLSIQAIC